VIDVYNYFKSSKIVERGTGVMIDKSIQILCALKNDVCETIQVIIDLEKNVITLNPEKCLECPFLEEKVRKSVIVLSGSPIPELYRKTPTFVVDFDFTFPRRTVETKP
jgi:hypothetical protein